MRRRPDPATETRARLFLLGMLIGLLSIILPCYYALVGFEVADDVAMLNAAIRTVDKARVAKYLAEMNATGLPRVFKPGQHPLYVLSCIPEEETEEAQELIRLVAHTFRTVPIDVGYAHHPLTAAYRHRRYRVAKTFLEVWAAHQPDMTSPMNEVYGSALSLADLRGVDASVFVYCEARDNFRCRSAVDAARLRGTSASQLEAAYALRHHAAQTPPPRIPFGDADVPRVVVAPASTIRAGFWSDPFRPPLPNVLPPRGTLVMNPGYFRDLADQFLYMIFGHVQGSMALTNFIIFALSVTCFFMASWAVGVTCWLVRSN